MKSKLWNQDATNEPTTLQLMIEDFTVGHDRVYDLLLAEADVMGSLAHASMLASIGIITEPERASLEQALDGILEQILHGNFVIEDGVEDVHSQIELTLTRELGDIGKKIHSGRSRNDQSLLDIKLFIREELKKIALSVQGLFQQLIALSNQHRDNLLPGYTHLQLAMPSSFGLWFGAYAESLSDDLELLEAAYRIANRNPLGSGAGYGSSFPLDRELTTRLLAFEGLNYNVVYAQMTRGKTEKTTAMALSGIGATLSRLSADICLYLNQNFQFISFPSELTTGSSIMPHKKNPDVFELIRARCNRIQALPNELTLLGANLTSGYHRDMQLTKECLFPALFTLKQCLDTMTVMLEHITVRPDILNDPQYLNLFSVEKVNELVLSGIPFREAYGVVAKLVAEGKLEPVSTLNHTHAGSMGNLCNDEISAVFAARMRQIMG